MARPKKGACVESLKVGANLPLEHVLVLRQWAVAESMKQRRSIHAADIIRTIVARAVAEREGSK